MRDLAPLLRPGPTLVAFLVLVGALAAVFHASRRRGYAELPLLLPAALALAAAAVWATQAGIDWDEGEHLHAAWRVAHGERPYVDFWQHHAPTLWWSIVPVLRVLGAEGPLHVTARVIAVALSAVAGWLGWRVARRIGGRDADGAVYLLVLGAGAVTWQFAFLRPDLPAHVAWLAVCLGSLAMRTAGTWTAFGTGAAAGIALAFTPKNLPMALLPIIAALCAGEGRRARRIGAVAAGAAAGLAPLLGLLAGNDLLRNYARWVLRFNAGEISWAPAFGLVPAVIGLMACVHAVRRRDRAFDTPVLAMLALATIGAIPSVQVGALHHLGLWSILVAAAAAGLPVRRWIGEGGIRALGCAVAIALLLVAPARQAWNARGRFAADRARRAEIVRIARGRTVLLFHPEHPVTLADATRLHSRWQLRFTGTRAGVAPLEPDVGPAFLDRFIAARPALVAPDADGIPLPEALARRGVLDREDAQRLADLLRARYVRRNVAGRVLLVDRALATR